MIRTVTLVSVHPDDAKWKAPTDPFRIEERTYNSLAEIEAPANQEVATDFLAITLLHSDYGQLATPSEFEFEIHCCAQYQDDGELTTDKKALIARVCAEFREKAKDCTLAIFWGVVADCQMTALFIDPIHVPALLTSQALGLRNLGGLLKQRQVS